MLDYPTWYPLVSAFTNSSGNITDLATKVWDAQARYRTGEFLVGSFLDNHDNPRFMSFVKDHAVRANVPSAYICASCAPGDAPLTATLYTAHQERNGVAVRAGRNTYPLSRSATMGATRLLLPFGGWC